MSRIIAADHARRIAALADRIEEELARLPELGHTEPLSFEERQARRAAYERAVEEMTVRLAVKGGGNARVRIAARWDGASVSAWGLRASSTSGTAAALSNWVAQARRKLAEFEARHGRAQA